MPDGKTPITNFNPNEFKVVDNSKKTLKNFNPNEFKVIGQAPPKLREGDTNIVVPKYTTPQELEIDSAINFIDKQAIESGRTSLSDERKDILKKVLSNPSSTKEQKEQTILTMQGYDKDTNGDVSNKFYMEQGVNGVYVPKLLKHGTRPPKGAAINSFHGTQLDANNDAWYTDLSKSLANGLVSSAGGLVDLMQAGTMLVTDKESEFLNDAKNSVDFFKFKKDEDLNVPLYNMEGIEKWADLLDKDRVVDMKDLPSAIWGTVNGLAESLSEFGFSTLVGGSAIKGLKGAKYALEGTEKAVELGNVAQKGAILFGSTVSQLGDVMDVAKDAGLKGRDAAAWGLTTATAMGTIDALTGLEGKVMSGLFKRSKRQILENAIKTVERDASGNITPQAFKELSKKTAIQYGAMAKNATKEIVKDAIGEGTQEGVQDFIQKSSEQLWDKLTDDERGQFGTDATDAKSFGSYINSIATGFVSGVPMAFQTKNLRNKHDEQSIHIYDRVKQGKEGVDALKVDLDTALKGGDINQAEYEQANFKIDAYNKYNEETKSVNLKPEDEKKAFELSFQIQGLKTEIPTNENEISKLDPIARAKVESKQKQAKELQSELNDIIRQGEIKGEPVVPKKEEERVQKEKEKEAKANETKPTPKKTRVPKPRDAKVDLEDSEGTTEVKVGSEYKKEPKLPKQPDLKDETRTYDTVDNETFNHTRFPSRTKFKMVVDKLSKFQNKEMSGVIKKKSYKYYDKVSKQLTPNSILEVELEDGKRIRFASSQYHDSKTEEGFRSHTRNERLLGNEEGVPVGLKLIDINNPFGLPTKEGYIPGKKVLKIYNKRTGQFLSWAKETHKGKSDSKKEDGSLVTTAEEGDILKTLEGQRYNEDIKGNEGDIARLTAPKPKPITPITKKAEDATEKIVEESKEKVKQSKIKENGKDKNTPNGEKPIRGNNEETNGESEGTSKELKLPKVKQNKNRSDRGIKNPFRKKASEFDPANAYESVITYFAGKGFVSMDSLRKFFKETKKYNIKEWVKTNTFKRQNLTQEGAPNIDEVANSLWENQSDRLGNLTTEDYKNAIEEVLRTHASPVDMAKELLENNGIGVNLSRLEEITMNAYETAEKEGYLEDLNNVVEELESKTDEKLKELAEKDKWEEGTDIVINNIEGEPFQKVSQRKGDFTKVRDKIAASFPKINVEVNADKFNESQSTVAGKVSADGKTITINPNYAGFDTPIHEAGHILIDAIGYNNKVIQSAIKQLRNTPLYAETKERYKELSESELDKEVLAEAIGREGADIFDKIEDRSKFKAYLDYIFDWLKQKLGMDKNIAKSLAKQIIGGVRTRNLEGTNTGKEQLQKTDNENKPPSVKPLSKNQYANENGFDYAKEQEKLDEAYYLLSEAQEELDIAKENAEDATTDEEAVPLEGILSEKEAELKKARTNVSKVGKKIFEYKKYRKDFIEIQNLMSEKATSDYTTEELQDLISKLHGFDNKAAKAFRADVMIKLALEARIRQIKISGKHNEFIEELSKSKDITPLQRRILHHSHFTENNPDAQAVSLSFSNAILDKIADANSKKATHEKLGEKVIAEENKKLGIVGAQANRFSSDAAKYFNWMENDKGELLTVDEAKAKGLSEAKINYLKFTRETIADFRGQLEENNFENAVMDSIRIDKNFMEAYKSEGLLPAFSYYLGGGANNLGKVRIVHEGKIKSYSEIEKEILARADRKSITSMAKALWDLLVANVMARKQLKKGFNVDNAVNPLEVKGEAEYTLNEKGQLVSKFDKPRAKDRGYSKDFYKAMNQFIDESAHTKHISKIMPLVDSVEYLNKNGYTDEGFIPKPNVAKWMEDWKKLHIFKEPHVNDPVLDAAIKAMRKLVASTTMWFNIPANVLNVFMGNYSNWRQENGSTVLLGNKRLFGGKGERGAYGLANKYALEIIKKYNIVNQDYDSNPMMKAGSILSKLGTWGTQVGEYQIQGSLGLGMLTEDEFNSFEFTKDKYGNDILTVKKELNGKPVDEAKIKAKMIQVKNRVTDIQGKYPDEDRRNIMKGEIGKAAFQFKVWMPDWFKERFGARYTNAYGVEKEGTLRELFRVGIKEMKNDLKKGDFKAIAKNKAFMSNLKGVVTIGTLMALAHGFDDDDDKAKKGGLTWTNVLSQVLFILDLEQDKYMVSNPAAALGKIKDLLAAFEALVTEDEKTWSKVKRVLPANKAITFAENQMK